MVGLRARFGLKATFASIIGLIVLIVVVGSGSFSYFTSLFILRDSIYESARMSAEQNAEIVSNWVQAASREIDALSGASAVRGMKWNEQERMLNSILSRQKDYETMFVADKKGQANTTHGKKLDVSDWSFFKEAMETGNVTFSEPIISEISGELVFIVARPIIGYDSNVIEGVLGATVRFNYLQDLIGSMQINGFGHGWIVDGNKKTIAHPNTVFLGNNEIHNVNDDLAEIVVNMIQGSNAVDTYFDQDTEYVIAYAPVSVTGWSVASVARTQDVFGKMLNLGFRNVLISVLALVLGVILAAIFATKLAQPIIKLKEEAELVAQGDLRREISIRRNDEIGLLAQSFNKMIDSLKELIAQVQSSGFKVHQYSELLSSATTETGTAIDEIAATATTFAGTIDIMNLNAQEMTEATEQISHVAVQSESELERTVAQTGELELEIQSLAREIDNLAASSQEVGKITTVIAEIAEQTNLLALNAAIEAARAGENGRGFAVVAEEVRKLSEQSTEATQTIARLIEEMQSKSKQVVTAMDRGVEKARQTTEVVQQSSKLLHVVLEGTKRLVDQITEITTGIEQIGMGSQDMAAATEEISATIQEVASSASELERMADELQEIVQLFEIE